ncbi:hypothetical protein Tco_0492396 [Tanacetum coccineum]
MTRIVAWCLGFMKWVSEDPSYVIGGEPEYPQELFSAVDLLFLQFLSAPCTQRKVSIVSFGRISPNSFLSSILLVVVIIVTVVIIMVILIVVVIAIVGVVIVVAIFGVVSMSYVAGFLQSLRNFLWNNVPIGIVSANAMVQLVLPERTVIPSEMSCWMTAKSYGWCNQDANALLGGILSTQDNA